jgi:hypothetical protein
MEERLDLDRSGFDGRDVAVRTGEQCAVTILSHPAEPFPTWGDDAASVAERAPYIASREL